MTDTPEERKKKKRRLKQIKRIYKEKLFSDLLSGKKRHILRFKYWFVGRLIDHYASTQSGASVSRSRIRRHLRDARNVVEADHRRRMAMTADDLRAFDPDHYTRNNPRINGVRAQVVYSVLGVHLGFLLSDDADSGYRDFLIERRFRGVMRMHDYVNYIRLVRRDLPDGDHEFDVFRYAFFPGACDTDETGNQFQLNEETAGFWRGANEKANALPFILEPSKMSRPDDAIARLFREKEACQANLLDCANAAATVLLDSLLMARDSRRLLTAAIAENTNPMIRENYVTVDHPETNWGNYKREDREKLAALIPRFHIYNDRRPRSLFEYTSITFDEMQIGDRVYLYNHPLYRTFDPNGAWAGEHALVYDMRDRRKRGIQFEGHGMQGEAVEERMRRGRRRRSFTEDTGQTIPGLYRSHFVDLNQYMGMMYVAARVHLGYLESPPLISPNGVDIELGVPKEGFATYTYTRIYEPLRRLSIGDGTRRGRRPGLYPIDFSVIQHIGAPKFSVRYFTHQEEDPEGDEEPEFGPDTEYFGRSVAKLINNELPVEDFILIERRPPPGAPPRPIHSIDYWGLPYRDRSISEARPIGGYTFDVEKFWPLTRRYGRSSRVVRHRIRPKDIVAKTLFVVRRDRGQKDADLTVTRPRASLEPDYVAYLRDAGAF